MNFFISEGIVQKGDGKGSQLGFPTANILCDPDLPSGIFAGEVVWKGVSYPAALYKEEGENILEAYILDFSQNLYGETITMIAREKIRDVKKFPSEKELITAIKEDIEKIRRTTF